MNPKADPAHHHAYELGCSFGQALRQMADQGARARHALLLDLLGEQRTLLAPLRHLVESPNFQELLLETSGAVRIARRDALLSELSTWCNRETLERLGAFLAGALNLPGSDNPNLSPNPESANPKAVTSEPSPNQLPSAGYRQATTTAQEKPPTSASQLLAEGRRLLAAKQYMRAIDTLDRAADIAAPSAELYRLRGQAHQAIGNHGLAIAYFSNAISHDPKDAFAHALRGQSYQRQGSMHAALADWNTAASLGFSQASRWVQDFEGSGNISKPAYFVHRSPRQPASSKRQGLSPDYPNKPESSPPLNLFWPPRIRVAWDALVSFLRSWFGPYS